jgi:hypothetical protein
VLELLCAVSTAMTQLGTRLAVLFTVITAMAVLLFTENALPALAAAGACFALFLFLAVRAWRDRIE